MNKMMHGIESENQNCSSAYSSLTNSTNELVVGVSEAMTVGVPGHSGHSSRSCSSSASGTSGGSASPCSSTADMIHNNVSPKRHHPKGVPSSGSSSRNGGGNANTSMEIRTIIDDYNATLKRATKEIKALTTEKKKLEKEYEKLLTINETLAADLENTLRQKKLISADHQSVLKANDELYEEAQRLSDIEAKWQLEKEQLEGELAKLSRQLEDLDKTSSVSQVLAENHSHTVEQLQKEKTGFVSDIAKLEMENKHLRRDLEHLEEQREEMVSRNEKIAGENMQMILEAQELAKVKTDMNATLSEVQRKYKELERDNNRLKARLDEQSSRSPMDEPKVAKLVEQNKNLTMWREQLIEKNQSLVEENKKLQDKCANLETLLNEEETDINDVLELIKNMQTKNGGPANPVSPMSAIGKKFRDMNYK